MENVILIVHLILALALVGVVLLQRSEGGGLGMGGGAGVMTGRGAATALGKVTWGLAACFITTSLALTIIAAEKSAGSSVVDGAGDLTLPAADGGVTPDLGGGSLLPPTVTESLVPEAPVEAPAETPAEAPAAAPAETPAPAPTDAAPLVPPAN